MRALKLPAGNRFVRVIISGFFSFLGVVLCIGFSTTHLAADPPGPEFTLKNCIKKWPLKIGATIANSDAYLIMTFNENDGFLIVPYDSVCVKVGQSVRLNCATSKCKIRFESCSLYCGRLCFSNANERAWFPIYGGNAGAKESTGQMLASGNESYILYNTSNNVGYFGQVRKLSGINRWASAPLFKLDKGTSCPEPAASPGTSVINLYKDDQYTSTPELLVELQLK